jgi:hypothetical protein
VVLERAGQHEEERTHASARTRTYTHTHTRTCARARTHTHTHAYTHAHTHTRTDTHTHAHTHTHTHTHTHQANPPRPKTLTKLSSTDTHTHTHTHTYIKQLHHDQGHLQSYQAHPSEAHGPEEGPFGWPQSASSLRFPDEGPGAAGARTGTLATQCRGVLEGGNTYVRPCKNMIRRSL